MSEETTITLDRNDLAILISALICCDLKEQQFKNTFCFEFSFDESFPHAQQRLLDYLESAFEDVA